MHRRVGQVNPAGHLEHTLPTHAHEQVEHLGDDRVRCIHGLLECLGLLLGDRLLCALGELLAERGLLGQSEPRGLVRTEQHVDHTTRALVGFLDRLSFRSQGEVLLTHEQHVGIHRGRADAFSVFLEQVDRDLLGLHRLTDDDAPLLQEQQRVCAQGVLQPGDEVCRGVLRGLDAQGLQCDLTQVGDHRVFESHDLAHFVVPGLRQLGVLRALVHLSDLLRIQIGQAIRLVVRPLVAGVDDRGQHVVGHHSPALGILTGGEELGHVLLAEVLVQLLPGGGHRQTGSHVRLPGFDRVPGVLQGLACQSLLLRYPGVQLHHGQQLLQRLGALLFPHPDEVREGSQGFDRALLLVAHLLLDLTQEVVFCLRGQPSLGGVCCFSDRRLRIGLRRLRLLDLGRLGRFDGLGLG